jgi:hypothetical protein
MQAFRKTIIGRVKTYRIKNENTCLSLKSFLNLNSENIKNLVKEELKIHGILKCSFIVGSFFVSQVNPDDNDIKTFRGKIIEIYQPTCIEEDFFDKQSEELEVKCVNFLKANLDKFRKILQLKHFPYELIETCLLKLKRLEGLKSFYYILSRL